MPSTKSEFDPVEGVDYAKCLNCGKALPTPADMTAHFEETKPESKWGTSHRVNVKNPTRAERIERGIEGIVEDAVMEILDKVDEFVQRGEITEDEAREALRTQNLDLLDAYHEYIEEGS